MVRVRIGPDGAIEELTWDDWEERVRAGRIGPDALIHSPPLTGTSWVVASELEVFRSLRSDATEAWHRASARAAPPILTALLVGLQIRIWWVAHVPEAGQVLVSGLAKFTNAIFEDGESWRLLTMGILHVDLLHVGLNMMWMAYTGWSLEKALGRVNLAVLYFGSVLGGSVLSALGSPDRWSLGASGGVFGLIAAVIVYGLIHPELVPRRGQATFGLAMIPYAVMILGSGLMNERTDNWAHFGGLLTGAALALVLDPPALQRRPGWNRAWYAATGAVATMCLLLPPLFGRRLLPLRDSEVALRVGQDVVVPETGPPPYRSLTWRVPVGWKSTATDAGDMGFGSPVGHRRYSVVESSVDGPAVAADLEARWVEQLRAGWPDAIVEESREITGGRAVRARLPTSPERILDWQVRTRGSHALQQVRTVDTQDTDWLDPLFDRIEASVAWGEPAALVEARATRSGVEGRVRFARERVRNGEIADGIADLRAVLTEDPDQKDAWSALLDIARWYPVEAEADRVWAEALAARPEPRTVVDVARGLEAAGRADDARGLLEIAWHRFPGDRVLSRARRSRGMWVAIGPDGRPWEPAPRDGDAPELRLGAARDAGLRYARDVAELHAEIRNALGIDPALAADLVLRAKTGPPPDDLPSALVALGEDLRSSQPPPWLPADLFAAAAADPGLVALTAPPLPEEPPTP